MSDKRGQAWLAVGLTVLAGYVDAVGFLHLGHVFIAFMGGNTTQLGVGLAGKPPPELGTMAAVLCLFILGAVAGHLVWGAARRKAASVLTLVTALLLCGMALLDAGQPTASIAAIALSMGAMNATFGKSGGIPIPVTYPTGTLVNVGELIAAAVTGGAAFAWLVPLVRVCGFVAGSALGALAFPALHLDAIWLATAAAAALTATAWLFYQRG